MKLFIGILVAIGLLVGIAVLGTDSSKSAPQRSMQSVQKDMASGGQLLDVRTPAEFASGHIDGASNFALQNIQAGAQPPVAKDKPVYVYCQSGNRSSQAARALKAEGYQNVIDLGGIGSVQRMGGKLVKS